MTSPAWTPVRVPSFWLLTGTVGFTSLGLIVFLLFLAFTTPLSALVALPLVAAYTVAVLLVVRSIDQLARRPWWLVALAFGWGATVSVAVGAGSSWFLDDILAKTVSPWFAALWGAALVAPTAEELAKGAGVLLLFLAARPHLRTVFAGAVYGAIVGVGFAAVEDLGYALIAADDPLPDDVSAAASMVVLRALVPGVAGHALFTATFGAGVTYLLLRSDRSMARRVGVLVAAIGLSWLTHAAVNAPFALAVPTWPQPAGDLAGYLLIVWVPTAAAVWWLARLRRVEIRQAVRRLVSAEPPAATESEAQALTGYVDRARVRRLVRDGVAPATRAAAGRAVREVQRALLALADEMTRPAAAAAPAAAPVVLLHATALPPYPALPVYPTALPVYPAGPGEWPAPLTGQPAVPAYPGYPARPGWYPGYPPYPPPGYPPVAPPPAQPSPLEQARTRLERARTALREVAGDDQLPEMPARPDTGLRPVALVAVLLLGAAGVFHWAAALTAVVLAVAWLIRSRVTGRAVRPVDLAATAVAVASLHLWAASLLAVALFAHEF
ncbi:PrsW family intramembrane metalloprotease [Micromonospora sp. LOL_023]|uniref:PrsW family intramembrane metalloprotease n=1 Tax=Micromonospora sp. LOL_023 TaxID=3345418 RepID=UPI003A86CC4F